MVRGEMVPKKLLSHPFLKVKIKLICLKTRIQLLKTYVNGGRINLRILKELKIHFTQLIYICGKISKKKKSANHMDRRIFFMDNS